MLLALHRNLYSPLCSHKVFYSCVYVYGTAIEVYSQFVELLVCFLFFVLFHFACLFFKVRFLGNETKKKKLKNNWSSLSCCFTISFFSLSFRLVPQLRFFLDYTLEYMFGVRLVV
eukprot:Rmarinus@m.22600